ncbi:bifunctional metallophosphatase/5'-nucleotidase [Luteipulveratus mongoliensis]|uniref:Uncharacterized protein n=1 Tax=Luteipulveratus mongoliensis TaxID=571913 RepID=A0A0K1JNQ1_9MICO|nr:5'-nucleotidase C-terminal domain-containing protein [Luteipulveratus mongoliensis]AKU18341.1 hypothetical protein VV02_25005 [Luteipulveratus mongoliensis]
MSTLELLHWNDIHGRYDALARLSTQANGIRKQADHPVLLLDGGDVEEASVRVSALSYGAAGWRVLQACAVDAAVVGNGGMLRYGPGLLPRYADGLGSSPLVCNVSLDGEVPVGASPSAMLKAGELSIGVIGATAWIPSYAAFGLVRLGTAEAVLAEAQQLRADGADVVILLSHCGIDEDREVAAELVGAVDVIVGGHSHTLLPDGDREHGVPIAQAGQFGEHLGRVVLDIANGQVSIRSMNADAVPEETPVDPAVLTTVDRCERDLDAWLVEPVAQLPRGYGFSETGHSEVAALVAEALLAHTPGDFAAVLAAQCEGPLDDGTVTRGQVWAATSSPGNPTTATLTGAQVRAMLTKAVSKDYISTVTRIFRGRPFGRLHLAGAAVDGEVITVGGEPLVDDRSYRVVGTDVELSTYGRLVGEDPDDLTILVPTIIPEFLEEYLTATYPVS